MAGRNPTAVNISIGLDHTPLQNGIKVTRSEIAAFVAETRKLATDEEKYLKSVRRAQKMHDAGQLSENPELSLSMLQSRIAKLKEYYGVETELERRQREHNAELIAHEQNIAKMKKNSKEMELKDRETMRNAQALEREKSIARTVDKEKEALALIEKQTILLRSEKFTEEEILRASELYAKELGLITDNSRLEASLKKQQLADEKMLEQAVTNIKTKRQQDLAIIQKRAELMRQAGYSNPLKTQRVKWAL